MDTVMRRCASTRLLFVFFFLLCAVVSGVGQSNYAVVTGTITDSQSLPVTGATVSLKALSTGTVRVLTSNERGVFSASALLPDDYELTTEANGFATVVQPLHLEVGEKLGIDIPLKVGTVKEGLQVNAASDVLRTTDASVGEVVERQSVQELPLNGRMLIDLVLTVPGAHVGFARRQEKRIHSIGALGSGQRL
jgi:Carboxypeptidase regulatory-like domain